MFVDKQHPRAGTDYPGTWPSFEAWFPDDEACRDFLARVRWPDGFVCPRCNSGDAWRTGRGLWMCRSCDRQTSVTAGTIFHRSRYPLKTWFAAMWFRCPQKNGISALGLQRAIGFGSYETAWAWMHKLRRAMVRPDRELLGGDGVSVEADQHSWADEVRPDQGQDMTTSPRSSSPSNDSTPKDSAACASRTSKRRTASTTCSISCSTRSPTAPSCTPTVTRLTPSLPRSYRSPTSRSRWSTRRTRHTWNCPASTSSHRC